MSYDELRAEIQKMLLAEPMRKLLLGLVDKMEEVEAEIPEEE